jgi:uncharacterized protein
MLGLEPHPTCSFVAETYHSPLKIPPSALPEAYNGEGDRPLRLGARLPRHPQCPDRHASDTLRPALPPLPRRSTGGPDALPRRWRCHRYGRAGPLLGYASAATHPGGTFHTSRLAPGEFGRALLASTEWPEVEPTDVEHGDIDALTKAYPDFREQISAFAR